MTQSSHQPDFTCKRLPTSRCPVEWDAMEGSETCRTCTRCGTLVFNPEHLDTPDCRAMLQKFKEPNQKCLYRRHDGKLLLRHCGMRPNYSWTMHFVGWTGLAALFFLVVGYRIGLVLPPPIVFYALYFWNILGALVLARTHLNTGLRRACIALFLVPIIVIEIMAFTSLALFIYWGVMFPGPAINLC